MDKINPFYPIDVGTNMSSTENEVIGQSEASRDGLDEIMEDLSASFPKITPSELLTSRFSPPLQSPLIDVPALALGAPAPGDDRRAALEDAASDEAASDEALENGRDTTLWKVRPSTTSGRVEADGQIISGRYRILENLAEGGMARIFKVEHLDLGKIFALKIIHHNLSEDPRLQQAFIREARIASSLEHPHIVQITDFGVDDAFGAYIVMEFLKGETLSDRIHKTGPMKPALALDIALHVAEALHTMHAQDIVHCDIKPENIFLAKPALERRRTPVVKLIDFGLSRTSVSNAKLSRSEVAGTPYYMAPEQILGSAPRPSMDVYALGCVLYEMLTGRTPFLGPPKTVLTAQLEQKPELPTACLKRPLDEQVEGLVMKALAKGPRERQVSMGRMVFELRTVLHMLGVTPPSGHNQKATKAEIALSAPTEDILRVFADNPCPQLLMDSQARIRVVNPAFAQFVGQPDTDLVGQPIDETRLFRVAPDLKDRIIEACRSRTSFQQVLSFRSDSAETVSMLFWLIPESGAETQEAGASATIIPLTCVDAGVACANRRRPSAPPPPEVTSVPSPLRPLP